MSEKNFFGLSRSHYDPLAGSSRPLIVPERPTVSPTPSSALHHRQQSTKMHLTTDIVRPRPAQKPISKPTTEPIAKPIAGPVLPLTQQPTSIPKLSSPAIHIDDLLNDFVEKKSKAKKPVKARKIKGTLTKLTHKLAARQQAQSDRRQAKTAVKKKTKSEKAEKIATKKASKAAARTAKAKVQKTPKMVEIPKTQKMNVKKAAPSINTTENTDFAARALTVAADTTAAANSPASLMMDGGEAAVAESENRLPKIYFEIKINKKRVFAFIRTIIVMAILAVSGYLIWDMWLADQTAHKIFSNPVAAVAAIDEASPTGADVTSISNQAWAAHATPADQARYVYLPSINARARVISVGINSKGKIDSPKNVNDVAWYDGSAKPGQEGQVFITGHSSFAPTYKAAFDRLAEVKIGDRITIERGDGKKIIYRVVNTETVKTDKVDMRKVLNVPDQAARGLTLMSCTGEFNYRTQSSDTRVIVYAIQE